MLDELRTGHVRGIRAKTDVGLDLIPSHEHIHGVLTRPVAAQRTVQLLAEADAEEELLGVLLRDAVHPDDHGRPDERLGDHIHLAVRIVADGLEILHLADIPVESHTILQVVWGGIALWDCTRLRPQI